MSAALIRGPAIGPFIRELHAAQLAAWSRWDELCPPAEHRALVLRLRAWPRDEAAHRAFQGLRAAYQATPEFRAWAPLYDQLSRAITAPLRGSVYRGAPDFESALILLAAPERAMGLCYTRRWLLDRFKRRPLPADVESALRALAFAAIERREYGHCRGEIVGYRRFLIAAATAGDVARLRCLCGDPSRFVADKAARALAVVLQGRPGLRELREPDQN